MNIIERARSFHESLRVLDESRPKDWQQCPHCHGRMTIKNGSYHCKPWDEHGRERVRIQRHLCHACGGSYPEENASLVRRSWYTRAVHRQLIDAHVHLGSSLRKAVEHLRSEIGKQERWLQWHPLAEAPREEDRCGLSVRTGERWLAQAGVAGLESVPDQLKGIRSSGEMATDGLWTRLADGTKRVVLMVADGDSGVVYPPVVVEDEENAASWGEMFTRVETAGLDLKEINGLTSDGAQGLLCNGSASNGGSPSSTKRQPEA